MTSYTFPVTYTEAGAVASSTQTLVVYDRLVSELLMNGANAGTSFPDTTGPRVWTRNGNAQTSTAQFVEGTASCLLDGTGDFLSAPSETDFQNQGDWRIECAIRAAAIGTLRCISSKRAVSGSAQEWAFYLDTTGKLRFLTWDNTGATLVVDFSGTTVLAATTWYDVAIERYGSTYRLELGGATEATATQSATPIASNAGVCIGRDGNNSTRDFNGYIDRWRFLRA